MNSVMKTIKAYEIEIGDAIMYEKKYFVVDWIDPEFISEEIANLYLDVEDEKDIRPDHCMYTFEDGLTLNYKVGSECRLIQFANYDDEFEFLGKVEHQDYEKGIYDRRVKPKLRFEVLERDNRSCTICGRSILHGAILHIDHIIPVNRGGRTEKQNLRTLCDVCNYGKGGR